jgi:hypothetical protein
MTIFHGKYEALSNFNAIVIIQRKGEKQFSYQGVEGKIYQSEQDFTTSRSKTVFQI